MASKIQVVSCLTQIASRRLTATAKFRQNYLPYAQHRYGRDKLVRKQNPN
jgi:hypothetical protein